MAKKKDLGPPKTKQVKQGINPKNAKRTAHGNSTRQKSPTPKRGKYHKDMNKVNPKS